MMHMGKAIPYRNHVRYTVSNLFQRKNALDTLFLIVFRTESC